MAEEERGSEKEEMAPWEQHSSVISIPRFDFNAPSSLLQHSHSGFLITCPIKREKSATKEVITILAKYVQCFSSSNSEENTLSKRRKISEENNDGECVNGGESKDATSNSGAAHDEAQEGPLSCPAKSESGRRHKSSSFAG